MKRLWSLLLIGALPTSAQQGIPLRDARPQFASDSGALGSIAEIRHLRDGRVLVNDTSRHRLLAFDSTLKRHTDVLGAAESSTAFGSQPGVLIPYPGDSSIFLDVEAAAFVVLSPAARVVRTMAPPKAGGDLYYIARSVLARTQTDWRGRLLYSVRRPLPPNLQKPPEGNDTTGATQITLYPDSAPILRADFETRTIDTIAMFRIAVQKGVVVNQGGVYTGMMAFNPIPTSDEWVVLPDGAIAIVRAFDYHVDWLLPDGTRKSSPRMPFDWRRITPEDKVRILDSVREAAGALRAKFATSNPAPPPMMNGRPAPRIPFTTVEPDELPDFYPPIRMGQVRADLDGNVWILPATSTLAQPGLVYDVVNRAGAVFQRIRLPEGRNLVGFGPRGIVYLSYTRAPGWTLLEKATIGR